MTYDTVSCNCRSGHHPHVTIQQCNTGTSFWSTVIHWSVAFCVVQETHGSKMAFLDGAPPERLCQPMVDYFTAKGGQLKMNARIKDIVLNSDKTVKELRLADGETVSCRSGGRPLCLRTWPLGNKGDFLSYLHISYKIICSILQCHQKRSWPSARHMRCLVKLLSSNQASAGHLSQASSTPLSAVPCNAVTG